MKYILKVLGGIAVVLSLAACGDEDNANGAGYNNGNYGRYA